MESPFSGRSQGEGRRDKGEGEECKGKLWERLEKGRCVENGAGGKEGKSLGCWGAVRMGKGESWAGR